MEICYSKSSFLFDPFIHANRHFQVAFAKGNEESLRSLWERGVTASLGVEGSISLAGRIKHFILGALEYIPLVNLIILVVDRIFNAVSSTGLAILSAELKEAVEKTPEFQGYCFGADPAKALTELSTRPANLFYEGLFDGKDPTTQPGSGQHLAFLPSAIEARKRIDAQPDDRVISVSAKGKGHVEPYLGKNTFEISVKEVKEMLDSHQIWVSSLLPEKFYLAMKGALKKDGVVMLPGNDAKVATLKEILNQTYATPPSGFSKWLGNQPPKGNLYHFQNLLKEVDRNPLSFGFGEEGALFPFEELKELTVYQVGSMVVKSEDYHHLVEDGYRLASRKVGDKDAVKLISASGIRGFFKTARIKGNAHHEIDQKIMKHTFQAAFKAIGKGVAVFPAVGMGVWGGDPGIYWGAFFDALVEEENALEHIFVNPRHQVTRSGPHQGADGSEFALLLETYRKKHPNNANLNKIVNLYDRKTDLFLLAKNLKKASPDMEVALFNASDPDVTLGIHVGEYVNGIGCGSTTEENFAAAGTSGLGFEDITRVLDSPDTRVHQV